MVKVRLEFFSAYGRPVAIFFLLGTAEVRLVVHEQYCIALQVPLYGSVECLESARSLVSVQG